MLLPISWISTLITLIYLRNCSCLRNVRLVALPSNTVENGSTAILQCQYDLEGASLYMVTWYRGNHQVYRYLPSDSPPTKTFPIAGINVDVSRSNSTQLVLRWISFGASGKWTCELTTEAPSISTASSWLLINVIVISHEEPILRVDTTKKYESGDILKANCSAAASKPLADIQFYVNQLPVINDKGRSKIIQKPTIGGSNKALSTWSVLEMELTDLDLRRGLLIVECFTTVANTNRKAVLKKLKAITSEPSPQRVRSMSSSCPYWAQSWLYVMIGLLHLSTAFR